ncbi:hypothetical protein [Chromohalobacter sp. 11-W]|uniref:hypothetical protein n=1 Tax=Chromohalobacter sp. 11-W TaxID=2994061 RepID=UPI002468E887|nr:hypothetical protein [Chromohalobacter sp. 11-W]
MADDLEQFNTHQQDLRNRAQSLVRAIFVLSGGALTVSIGVFAGPNGQTLGCKETLLLQISWLNLFICILLFAFSLTVIIQRDYDFGERWRRKRKEAKQKTVEKEEIDEMRPEMERLIWRLSYGGLVAFCIGMLGLAVVAISVVGNA